MIPLNWPDWFTNTFAVVTFLVSIWLSYKLRSSPAIKVTLTFAKGEGILDQSIVRVENTGTTAIGREDWRQIPCLISDNEFLMKKGPGEAKLVRASSRDVVKRAEKGERRAIWKKVSSKKLALWILPPDLDPKEWVEYSTDIFQSHEFVSCQGALVGNSKGVDFIQRTPKLLLMVSLISHTLLSFLVAYYISYQSGLGALVLALVVFNLVGFSVAMLEPGSSKLDLLDNPLFYIQLILRYFLAGWAVILLAMLLIWDRDIISTILHDFGLPILMTGASITYLQFSLGHLFSRISRSGVEVKHIYLLPAAIFESILILTLVGVVLGFVSILAPVIAVICVLLFTNFLFRQVKSAGYVVPQNYGTPNN